MLFPKMKSKLQVAFLVQVLWLFFFSSICVCVCVCALFLKALLVVVRTCWMLGKEAGEFRL